MPMCPRTGRQVGRHSAILGRSESIVQDHVDAFVSFAATDQITRWAPRRPKRCNPDTWSDEFAHLSKPGQRDSSGSAPITGPTLRRIRRGKSGCASTAANSGGLGRERSFVHQSRGASVQARLAGRRDPSPRRLPFRPGQEERRDRYSSLPFLAKHAFDRSVRRSRRRDVRLIVGPITHKVMARRCRTMHRSNIFPHQ